MKAYGEHEAELHSLITLVLDRDGWSVLSFGHLTLGKDTLISITAEVV
jgi:hypothetical protein